MESVPPHLLSADPDQLTAAIWALLQNAVEASNGDHVAVDLAIATTDQGVVITVSDDGSGLTPEHAEAIFRPFFTTKTEGSGIGLTLARQIARAHGGELRLKPQGPGAGATFELLLPGT